MTDYRCDSGACPQITYNGDTVTIVEPANPGQVVVTPRASWDAYLDTIRAEERARVAAGLRSRAEHVDRVATPTGPYRSHIFRTIAGVIERGEFADLAAGDE